MPRQMAGHKSKLYTKIKQPVHQANLTTGRFILLQVNQFRARISCTYAYEQLQTFSYVLRLASRNALFYEFPAECQPLRSFF
jgi:hypothetical protein